MPTCKTNQTVISFIICCFSISTFQLNCLIFQRFFFQFKKYFIVIIDCQPATTFIQKTPSTFKGRYTCFAVIVTTTTFWTFQYHSQSKTLINLIRNFALLSYEHKLIIKSSNFSFFTYPFIAFFSVFIFNSCPCCLVGDFFSTLTFPFSSFGGIFVLFYRIGMYLGKNMLRMLR